MGSVRHMILTHSMTVIYGWYRVLLSVF